MESKLFWLAAVVQILASLRLMALVRLVERTHVDARVRELASGQRQDAWLAAAVIWTVILLKETPYNDALYLSGLGIQAWLTVRTFQRIAVLARGKPE